MAGQGEAPPFWLTADEQTAGRGRMERQWVSARGNLYSTFVGPPPRDGASLGLLPFVVSLSVFQALHPLLPANRRAAMALKWPNDVLIDGEKLSGILIEQRQQQPYGALIAIGIGINVEHSPVDLDKPATNLHAQGVKLGSGAVFARLRDSLTRQLDGLERTPNTILPAWVSKAYGVGQPIKVSDGGETLEGTFDHLAADGALMLRLRSGAMRAVRTGDVVIRKA